MSVVLAATFAAAVSCPAQSEALAAAADIVRERYHDVRQAALVADALDAKSRELTACGPEPEFVGSINRLLDVHDGHFLFERPSADGASDDWLAAWRADSVTVNAGVREVRLLEGNIGYLRLTSFYPWDLAGPKLRAAWSLLAEADGLILDLRGNGGGEEVATAKIARALLPAEITSVQAIETRAGRTADPLPDTDLPDTFREAPVAILIDRRSGSASEYIAYSLQALGRARVIGTRSGGVANLVGDSRPLPHGYAISIPEARPVNLTTGSNWEGSGVRPDIAGGDDPLHVARRELETLVDGAR